MNVKKSKLRCRESLHVLCGWKVRRRAESFAKRKRSVSTTVPAHCSQHRHALQSSSRQRFGFDRAALEAHRRPCFNRQTIEDEDLKRKRLSRCTESVICSRITARRTATRRPPPIITMTPKIHRCRTRGNTTPDFCAICWARGTCRSVYRVVPSVRPILMGPRRPTAPLTVRIPPITARPFTIITPSTTQSMGTVLTIRTTTIITITITILFTMCIRCTSNTTATTEERRLHRAPQGTTRSTIIIIITVFRR